VRGGELQWQAEDRRRLFDLYSMRFPLQFLVKEMVACEVASVASQAD
jgi:hypothetical protein